MIPSDNNWMPPSTRTATMIEAYPELKDRAAELIFLACQTDAPGTGGIRAILDPYTPMGSSLVGSTYPTPVNAFNRFYVDTIDSANTGVDSALQVFAKRLNYAGTCPSRGTNDVPASFPTCVKYSHCNTPWSTSCNTASSYMKVNVYYNTNGCEGFSVPAQILINHAYLP